MVKKFCILLFMIACSATIYYNGLDNNTSKMLAMACFGVLFLFAVFDQIKRRQLLSLFKRWLAWIILAMTVNMLYGLPANSILEIVFPLVVAFESYQLLDIPRNQWSVFFLPLCVFSSVCAVWSVLYGLGSLSIAEYYDNDIAKNQIGAAFTTFAIISAMFVVEEKRLLLKILFTVASIVNLYPALFFTCRTALLCYAIVVCFILFRVYGWRGFIVIPIIVLVVVCMGGSKLGNLLYESIVGTRDIYDVDDISSGRVTYAKISLDYFLEHPFFGYYGAMDGSNMPPNAHIFLLYRLTKWGLLGSIPFLVLYFSVIKIFFKSIKHREVLVMGTLFLALMESFSEYSPPFGPGSCFIPVFMIVGMYLRNK